MLDHALIYKHFCDSQLWRSWLEGRLPVDWATDAPFRLDAMPEPYVDFSSGSNPLLVLTTNPGGVLDFQRRDSLHSANSLIPLHEPFHDIALRLAAHYERTLRRKPAGRRIRSMQSFASAIGHSGCLQVEALPFHSESLPNKRKALLWASSISTLVEYTQHLKQFLNDRSVLIVDAVHHAFDLDDGHDFSPWIRWKARLAGMNLERAAHIPLVRRRDATSCTALVQRTARTAKAYILMKGTNQLPAEENLGPLVEWWGGNQDDCDRS